MSLRLTLASLWMPQRALAGMLDMVTESTLAALDAVLERHSPGTPAAIRRTERAPGAGVKARREALAAAHNARVSALVLTRGRDRAISEGRAAIFPVGVLLGNEARRRLGVGQSRADLVRAARILYRVLGIDFRLERCAGGTMTMRVRRCALAACYTAETCAVMSAADEGVVLGLNPAFSLRFERRMTEGCAECVAIISEQRE